MNDIDHLSAQLERLQDLYREDAAFAARTFDEALALGERTKLRCHLVRQKMQTIEQCCERMELDHALAQRLRTELMPLTLEAELTLEQRDALQRKAEERLRLQVQRLEWLEAAYPEELAGGDTLQGQVRDLKADYTQLLAQVKRVS